MSPRRKRLTFIGLALLCVLAAAVWMAWSPALLWFAKRQAIRKYAEMQDAQTLNVTLAPDVRRIKDSGSDAEPSEPQRVAAVVDGYSFSLPAATYQRLPGRYVGFDSEKLAVMCLGVLDLTDEFAKVATDDSATSQYLAKTDPLQILVDAFNAKPKDIEGLASFDDLNKHLALLRIKAVLMPVGADKHWEQFDTGKRQGFIAGDTSTRHILVTLYLPEHRQFAEIVINPKHAATMMDVYHAIAELDVCEVAKRNGMSERQVDASVGDGQRQLPDRHIPSHPLRARYLGKWQSEGETVIIIARRPGGVVTIRSVQGPPWTSVINNVRWDDNRLHYDEYNYYTGSEDFTTNTNPSENHPYSGVKNEMSLMLTDQPDRLKQSATTLHAPQPIEGVLTRTRDGG